MKHLNQFFALVATAIISISSSNLSAATRTWDGSSSSAWNTGANWSGNSVPNSGDDVIIPSGLTRYPVLSGNVSVRNFTMNGGTFSTSNFNLTVNSNLIINNGTFTSGSGTISSDNVDINNGTFTIQGNRLTLGNDFTIDGGTVEVTGADFEIDDDFFFLSGTLDMNGYDMVIIDNYTYEGGSLSNPGDLITANDVFVNFTGEHLMGISVRVLATMTFTNGIILTTPSNLLIFDNDAVVSAVSNTSHVNGPVKKEISASSTPNFTFPSGNGVVYAPISISSMGSRQTGDFFTAYYVNERNSNAGGTKGSGLNLVSQAEYWMLDRGTTASSATTTAVVTLSYNTSRSGPITNAALLKVARWNGSSWQDQGRSTSSSTSNTSGNVISSGSISSFSPFTLGSSTNVNPLPVSLLNFNAAAVASNVEIKWTTTSEINNDYFSVEKSLNGTEWISIGKVKGAGNTEVLSNYNFVDANPVSGIQYYRLKQTDINGEFTYSSIAPVNFSASIISQLNIFPIPASNFINVELPGASEMTVTVYNSNGQKVFESTSGSLINIDIQDFNAGLYIVEVKADNNVISSKFLKN